MDGGERENIPGGAGVPGVNLKKMTQAFAGGQNLTYCAGVGATWSGNGTDGRGTLQGGTKKSKIQPNARVLARNDTKRRNIADLAGYKKSCEDFVRKAEF